MRIISLTSIPPRFHGLAPTLASLRDQGADEVRLYIPQRYRRFPDWDGTLPPAIDGVSVMRVEEDLGPATKILPACRDLWETDAQILFCDDDCKVPRGWAKRLFDIQARRRDEAVAVYVRPAQGYVPNPVAARGRRAWQLPIRFDIPYRASRLAARLFGTRTLARRPFVIPGYGEIFFGAGGVVVRPDFFDDLAWDIPEIAWLVDDIWISANLARKGIEIYCPWMAALPRPTESAAQDALVDMTVESLDRQALNRAAARHCQNAFGIWQGS